MLIKYIFKHCENLNAKFYNFLIIFKVIVRIAIAPFPHFATIFYFTFKKLNVDFNSIVEFNLEHFHECE